jgi:hypothetical protein
MTKTTNKPTIKIDRAILDRAPTAKNLFGEENIWGIFIDIPPGNDL